MGRESLTYSRILIALAVVIVIVGVAAFGLSFVFDFGSSTISEPSQNIANLSNQPVSFLNVVRHWKQWNEVFNNIETEKMRADSLQAQLEISEDQNNSLRSTMGLIPNSGFNLIGPAGIFSFRPKPLTESFLVNKGNTQGVRENNVVVSDGMGFLGVVSSVKDSYSEVRDIRSSQTQITARIIGRQTQGLVKGTGRSELAMDLVTQNDEIQEGDVVVSSGNDLYPAGLVLGQVSYIGPNTTDIFKEIRIKPVSSNGMAVFIINF